MRPKKGTSTPTIDELVTVQDEQVLEALGMLFESKLQPFVAMILELKPDNVKLITKVMNFEHALTGANKKIDALEAYTRADNLIVVGLPATNFADAASADGNDLTSSAASSIVIEKAILDLCQNKLKIPIVTQDIWIAHHLKKSTHCLLSIKKSFGLSQGVSWTRKRFSMFAYKWQNGTCYNF